MAIRIIEEKPDPSIVRNCICKKCGVKLEYVPIDIQSFIYEDYGGGRERVYYIPCPRCQNKIEVKGY